MFISLLFTHIFLSVHGKEVDKPYVVFPVPLDLPHRNERAEQCWVRIEDNEILETVAVYCYIAQGFLKNHIYDYNSRKMTDDDIDVSLWSEEPRIPEINPPKTINRTSGVVDWKITTILDPITHLRLYVTQHADCRIIMYSREAETNYKVDCDKILFFINERMTNGAQLRNIITKLPVIILIVIFFIL
ncbi:unnamed protein product [Pieris macdunnoughi]|uniref:Uncharacterized protein n=1 Tax=Pieris macdunnoughi TaxID=345717 RepID=A0A821X926_9NEOP|nr:unnamed protein product [Pieris macdunnoughi]